MARSGHLLQFVNSLDYAILELVLCVGVWASPRLEHTATSAESS